MKVEFMEGKKIIWIFAILMGVIYLILPSSSQVKDAKIKESVEVKNTREYILYLPQSNGELGRKKILLSESLEGKEAIKALVQLNLNELYEADIEKQKIELWNLYEDGKNIYLTFNFKLSAKSQEAIQKTISELGIGQEVRILENGK